MHVDRGRAGACLGGSGWARRRVRVARDADAGRSTVRRGRARAVVRVRVHWRRSGSMHWRRGGSRVRRAVRVHWRRVRVGRGRGGGGGAVEAHGVDAQGAVLGAAVGLEGDLFGITALRIGDDAALLAARVLLAARGAILALVHGSEARVRMAATNVVGHWRHAVITVERRVLRQRCRRALALGRAAADGALAKGGIAVPDIPSTVAGERVVRVHWPWRGVAPVVALLLLRRAGLRRGAGRAVRATTLTPQLLLGSNQRGCEAESGQKEGRRMHVCNSCVYIS